MLTMKSDGAAPNQALIEFFVGGVLTVVTDALGYLHHERG